VGADEYARRYDVERVDRAVEDLRKQLGAVERRQAEVRDADNRAHAAEHKAIEERIERNRETHEREHEDIEKATKTDRQWTWNRTLAVITAACAVLGAYYLILSHSR
jgi:hypothetical protein